MKNRTQHVFIVLLFICSGLLGFLLSLYLHRNTNTMAQSANVRIMQTFHYPATFIKQLAGDPDAGRKIFNEFCSVCHSQQPSVDIQAPRIGDKKIWQGMHTLGMPALLKITINGKGGMPARGGCFECSDEQLRETIQYILQKSK